MDIQQIKDKIYKKVNKDDFVSFAEVERIFDEFHFDYHGNRVITHPEYDMIVFWEGWNQEAMAIFKELFSEHKDLVFQTVGAVIYYADREILRHPLAKRIMDYKQEHWLPVVLRTEGLVTQSLNAAKLKGKKQC